MLRHVCSRQAWVAKQGADQVVATRAVLHRSIASHNAIVWQFRNVTTRSSTFSSLATSTPSRSWSLPHIQDPQASRVCLFSTIPHDDEDDDHDNDGLPSNLTFDRRSSFAPQQPPSTIFVPRKTTQKSADGDRKDDDITDPNNEKSPIQEEGDDNLEAEDDDDIEEVDEDTVAANYFSDEPQYVIPLPERLKVDVHDVLDDGSVNGTLWLNPTVFGVEDIRIDLIQQNVVYIRNKIRGIRKAKTKTIGEVSGSGKKVRQQKGSGRARAGHSRPAHWRGGAKAHGPKQVDYGKVKMNKKARRLAMASTLSQKLKEGNLILVDHLRLPSHKTKEWTKLLDSAFGISDKDGSSVLILDHFLEEDETEENDNHVSFQGVPINVSVASGNLFHVKVSNQRFANVYEILKKDKLMITLGALEQIEAKWKRD